MYVSSFQNSGDPDQQALETNWSGSSLHSINILNQVQ